MKEILKVMRFDFLSAWPSLGEGLIWAFLLIGGLALALSPIIATYMTFIFLAFLTRLHQGESKGGYNKLYGILPVKRRNITRGRFMYVFFLFFGGQLIEVVLAAISVKCRLYRLIPNQSSTLVQFVKDSFTDTVLLAEMLIGMTLFMGLIFSYVEMMGQIKGRENEFRIIMITLGVLTVVLMAFFTLSDRGIIPAVKLPSLPTTLGGMVLVGIGADLLLFLICVIFGEITGAKLEKREL